jgi:predicted RND superfamily exporter protein
MIKSETVLWLCGIAVVLLISFILMGSISTLMKIKNIDESNEKVISTNTELSKDIKTLVEELKIINLATKDSLAENIHNANSQLLEDIKESSLALKNLKNIVDKNHQSNNDLMNIMNDRNWNYIKSSEEKIVDKIDSLNKKVTKIKK